MIEAAMIKQLCAAVTDAQVAALRAHLSDRGRRRWRAPTVSGRTRLLADFHVVLARMLGNEVLAQLLADLLSRCSLIALMYQIAHSAEHSADEHVAIVDALERRDSRAAARLMEEPPAATSNATCSSTRAWAELGRTPAARDDQRHRYPRDLRGYGRNPPHAQWPGGARIAVQFVLNYEEGGENNPLHGDPASETFLSELVTAQAYENRHMTMESMYEYGSRAGVWRLLREFERRGLPLTVFGVVMALQRYPELVATFMARGDEIASHGLALDPLPAHAPEATEREHVGIGTRTCCES